MKTILIFTFIILILASCAPATNELEEGTVLYGSFHEKTDFLVSSKNENGAVFSKGINGRGLNLYESHGNLRMKGAEASWFSYQKDFSVLVWVKASKISADTSIILSNADFRAKPTEIYGKRRTGKGITLYSCKGGWGWNIGNGKLHYNYEPVVVAQPIGDKKWHQLAFTYNSNRLEIRLYYDGINKAVLSIGDLKNEDFKSDFPMWIGENIDISPGYTSFHGTIDELKIWDKTISTEAIKKEFELYAKEKIKEPELESNVFNVVNWNIWHGGTHFIKDRDDFDGIERTTELIRNVGADIVLMQETYGAGSRISSNLDFYYYEAGSTIGAVWGANLSIMSRFPIEEAYMFEERSNYGKNYAFNNGGVKIRLSGEKSIIAFSNWYNRGKPEDLDGALNAWEALIDNADSVPIVFGGDFNSESHLDDGVGKSGHSKLMAGAGFIDSYRCLYPDVAANPGFSNGGYSSRIDYIYYKGEKLKLIEAGPLVPNFKGREDKTPGYPSDHLGIVAKFYVN